MVGGRVFIHSRWVWVDNDDDNDRVVGITRCYRRCCLSSQKMQFSGGWRKWRLPYREGGVMGSGFFRGSTLRICMVIVVYIPKYVVFFSDVNEVWPSLPWRSGYLQYGVTTKRHIWCCERRLTFLRGTGLIHSLTSPLLSDWNSMRNLPGPLFIFVLLLLCSSLSSSVRRRP